MQVNVLLIISLIAGAIVTITPAALNLPDVVNAYCQLAMIISAGIISMKPASGVVAKMAKLAAPTAQLPKSKPRPLKKPANKNPL